MYAGSSTIINVDVTIENSNPVDAVPQAFGAFNYEFIVKLSDEDLSQAGTSDSLGITNIAVSFSGGQENELSKGRTF